MGKSKKRKKKESSSSSSSSSDSDKKKAKTKPAPKAAPRFNPMAGSSDSEDAAQAPKDKTLGINESSAADCFAKQQWELMAKMKVDYQKQTDKKSERQDIGY